VRLCSLSYVNMFTDREGDVMTVHLTREAAERAQWTAQAAGTLHRHASTIADTCAEAQAGSIVVAVVEQDSSFGGTMTIPREQLHERIIQLEDHEGKWALTLTPMTTTKEIEELCAGVARLASRRSEVIERWLSLHS
jgi:hypothetical protein